jgi:glycerol kinase
MTRHLLAIDQGTTGSTVMLLDQDARVRGRATRDFPQHFPRPGEVEHDAEEIWASVEGALAAAYQGSGLRPEDCVAIGITNQRETTLVWDRATGKAIHRAIVWQDRRTAARCRELESKGLLPAFRAKTGLVLDAYFSGTKLEWILDHVEGARANASRGQLAFGTIDSFLVWRLSGGTTHVTDTSNASRTLLFDIHRLAWDGELCAHLRVPMSVLPEVRGSSEIYARTSGVPGLPDGIPIAGIAGDQQAALFGQTCFAVGDAKCTYGTGAFLLVNTGASAPASKNGLVTTVAWTVGGTTHYALEGSAFIAGAAVQWLRDGLGIIEKSSDVEALASKVASSDGVVFVPALSGLGAPHWDPDARGTIFGLTRGSTAAHLARATLEGIALSVADLGRAMEADMGGRIKRLRVDGGASENGLLMQYQSDVLDVAIERPVNVETTALGAAYLAGLAVGVFPDLDAVVRAHRIGKTFSPSMDRATREAHVARWHDGVRRARGQIAGAPG